MRRFLVTGGAGFIGSHIATALVERGDEVRILDNLSTGHKKNLEHIASNVTFVEGDLLDEPLVEEVVDGVDCIFHQAALASVPRSVERPLDTNAACVTGTLTMLDKARRAGVRRLVYAASSSLYGDQPFSSKRETDIPAPISPYGVAKLAGEYYCHAFAATYGFETVAIRYFNVFGPRQDPDSPYSAVIPLFITALLDGRQPTIFGDGTQSRDFTYVDNVVHGNLLAADEPRAVGKSFNVAGGGNVSLLQMLAALNRELGTDVAPIFAEPRAGDIHTSLADITLARDILGYEPQVSFDEGIRRSIEYYRELVLNKVY
ncbi:MAG: NAD-dependent epimerase/dehydratase family protein [Planctomycetota bacterium]|mgnify:CR=1 FL=1|nr:MAG: NAD-dependent epimerase/dehydratase family protein [Planctomycetota bacterium]REJ90320.1 MAG: NAD-dependent epimerase/dehydratase family protein [Planctomycetota bacterium]REK23130.1 MAG: NAD-dependent epimerase/dehydratase family protein [Planctomycetota bacterium]REK40939.1 MAG: NAD-dependent epimerase/dehydratase family protein [Planctomycetota bacterium]